MPRPTPWRREISAPLHVIQNELNRIFEEYWNPSRIGAGPTSPVDIEPSAWSPAIDLFDTPEQIVMLAELPGVEPSSIDLSLTGKILTLRGVKASDDPTGGDGPIRERRFGAFHRQIHLSDDVDFDAAQAESKNGVLTVRLPKLEAAKPRTIPVQNPSAG
ncbi:Hsp20/alpha crystallin family protein [Singulisphaera rosea]